MYLVFIVVLCDISIMNAQKKTETQTELMQTALRIPKDKHKQLKVIAAQNEKSLHDLYMEAIDYILKKYSSKSK